MFNLSGSEIVVILLLALIVLGPEKLPDAMRRAGKTFAEIKKLSSGFQDEVRRGFEEPIREVKQTAATVKSAARFPAVASKTTAAAKPRYNPETDPAPEPPEGSSVAEPLAETSPDAAEVNAEPLAPSDIADAAAESGATEPLASSDIADADAESGATAVEASPDASDDVTAPASDDLPPIDSSTTVEADRTA